MKQLLRMFTEEFPFEIQTVAENLTVPWALDISQEGTVYATERIGRIRTINNGRLDPEPLITFSPPFISAVEGGLMGIGLDLDFSTNHFLYVMHTYQEGNQYYNRVIRLNVQNRSARVDRVLLDHIPGGQIHNGGRLKIGPDRKLYVTTGDAGNAELAQDPSSLAGKILRMELDGRVPEDNPFRGSFVYSLGHRNPQGLAWNPNGIMYASEHGAAAHDEINMILPGANYGWPLVQGYEESSEVQVQKPLVHSGDETWAPSGIAYLSAGPWQGYLIAACLTGAQMLGLSLNSRGEEIRGTESWFRGEYGRLREVIQANDGSIYFTTSNRDGRGRPAATDDRIMRLIPKG